MVLQILLYGSEIWGFSYRSHIESVHIKYCKYILGVGSNASNLEVLGELGRKVIMDNLLCKMCQILAKLIIYGRK